MQDESVESASTECSVSLDLAKEHLQVIKTVREKASACSRKADKVMVKKRLSRHPPSVYDVKETVLVKLVKSKNCNKIEGKGVSAPSSYEGVIIDRNLDIGKYKVRFMIDETECEEWVTVNCISSITRADEKERQICTGTYDFERCKQR